MTLTITLSDQQEYLISQQNPITWPTQVITGNFGDIILLNRGVPNSVLYYRDGSTFTVPGGLDATTGLPSGGNPYVCVAEGTVDLTDPLNSDFEEYGDIWWFRDLGSQETPITIRSGDSTIYGVRVADFTVPPAKMSGGHQASGQVVGGVAYMGGGLVGEFYFVAENSLNHLDWKVANAQGGDAKTTVGGDQGAFFLAAAQPGTTPPVCPPFIFSVYNQPASLWTSGTWPRWGVCALLNGVSGGSGYTSQPVVTVAPPPTGAGYPGGQTAQAVAALDGAGHVVGYTVTHPGSGYDVTAPPLITITGGGGSGASATASVQGQPSSIIAFCNYFPGSYGTPSVLSSGSLAAGTYTPRYCYYKNVTINTSWGTYTAVIETPLSTPDALTISGGQKIQFTMALPDSRWDGVRVYMANDDWRNGPHYALQAPTTNFTVTATGLTTDVTNKGFLWTSGTATVTISSFGDTRPANSWASHGFSAWPAGTSLDTDPNAQTYALMKWAHVNDAAGIDGSYAVKSYQEGSSTNTNTNIAPASQDPKKMIANSPVTSRQSYMVVLGDNTGDSYDLAPQPVSGGIGDFKFEDVYKSLVALTGYGGFKLTCSVSSGLTVTVSQGSAYINNTATGRFDHTTPLNLTMTASRDNYIDWDGTTFHVTSVAVGAAGPAVYLASIRLFLVTTLTSTVQYIANLYGVIPWHNIYYLGRYDVTVANTSGAWSSASVSINLANGLFLYISNALPRLWAQQAVTLGGVEATTVMTFLTDATSSNGGLNYSLLVNYISGTSGTISFDVFATGFA